MKATEFLEALIGEKTPFEKLGGFDVEDYIEGKTLYKNTPIKMYGTSDIPLIALKNVTPRAPVSEFQRPASDTYAQALSGLL